MILLLACLFCRDCVGAGSPQKVLVGVPRTKSFSKPYSSSGQNVELQQLVRGAQKVTAVHLDNLLENRSDWLRARIRVALIDSGSGLGLV